MRDKKEFEDDGRVIADMSDIEMTPMIMPKLDRITGRNKVNHNQQDSSQSVYVDKEERRALIGGALSAALLVGGILAVSFGLLIFLMLRIWG